MIIQTISFQGRGKTKGNMEYLKDYLTDAEINCLEGVDKT